ncbi:MAG: VanZ family protein [Candidatus Omnitrophica bacterium]|nr:VanZ family protein [Candidatus Omnitrophota bacterium]MBU4346557.1 VanZ family protein [Candidatus Omnitrophota bacterium]MBU4472968.1 VanZ family protein [Candidatus Omnitrophota bacterium]MCG2707002.1 VanZ family protein [Candidatus Omnitrophota bacterium]
MAARIKKFIKYWLPVIIYAPLIFYLSSIPGKDVPQLFIGQDILFHIIEYAILALLINRALKNYNPKLIYARRFLWVFFVSVIYAASDEYHQMFVPGRCASGFDLCIDGIGSLIGSLLYR